MTRTLIVYFSGTFGTELVVENIQKSLIKKGGSAEIFPLDLSKVEALSDANDKLNEIDRLVVAYPVYSYDAPMPIHRWIDTLPQVEGIKTSVLSVSAGGEVPSNRTCRQHCIKRLEEKGFAVDYEKMITMPSNYAKTADDTINVLLIKAVPKAADEIADDILDNKAVREKRKIAIIPGIAANAFKPFAAKFGETLQANENCTDCKWCQENCPTGNIVINDGKMENKDQCALCLRCTYGCPTNAIFSKSYGFSVIKEGFSIKELQKKAEDIDEGEVKNIQKTRLWEGAFNYLQEVFK